ncbi:MULTISPECIES: hypothetical protein [Bacillus]|uniref:hypothetical protein n=1 Tax=Bacillus TaxID=1386 RepID=UPI000D04808D|nr:hypothetical protein [Bacillus sp. NMCN1]PRR90121.1 hypothetical protein C6W21_10285 [Bacillus sp. NMCN1]
MKILWRRIRLLESNSDIDHVKMEFYSVLIPVLLSKEIFQYNKDIKELLELFKFENTIGEYLFSNRTALVAKVIREIDRNKIEDINFNISIFKEFVLKVIEEKQLVDFSETTKFINKYSRNRG